jgi:hypothetical protein
LIEDGRGVGGIGVIWALVWVDKAGEAKVVCTDIGRVAVFQDLKEEKRKE